nr:hypothetical protein [Ardenticatena sp.]
MLKRRLLLAFMGMLWLLLATPAWAQSPIEVEVQPFFEARAKQGDFYPVRVLLRNDGAPREVVVAVRFSRDPVEVERLVDLPTGAQKAVTLALPATGFGVNTLRVVVRDSTTHDVFALQDVDIRFYTSENRFVGRLRGAGKGLDFLSTAEMELADVSLDALPEHPALWHMLDMLIISGVDTSSFSPAVQRSLMAWVSRGGTLVLGGGADAAAVLSGLPEAVQPVRLDGVTTVTADDLALLAETTGEPLRVEGAFAFANATPTKGFVQLALDDGRPLLVQQQLGFGTIYWLALDPNQSPFDAWGGREAFWNVLLPPDLVTFAQPVFEPNSWAIRSGASQLLDRSLPSLWLLGVVLLLYILFVGPINYLVLRAKRRLEWAWVTIPLFTLLFSVLTYMWGTRLRGTDLWVIEASIGVVLPNDTMESEGGALFFSPYDETFTLEAPGDTFVNAFAERGDVNFGGPNVLQAKTFRSSDRAQVGPVSMRPGTQVVFYVAPPVQPAPVHIESTLNGEGVTIRITNTGDYPLKNLVLFHEQTRTRHPELAPGETWTVQWGVEHFSPRLTPFFTWPVEYFVESNEMDETYRIAREQFLSGMFNARFMSNMPPPLAENSADPVQSVLQAPLGGDVFFGAWLDAPMYNFGLSDTVLKTRAMHLLVARFSISSPEAPIILPGDIPVWPEAPFDSLMRCNGWWGVGASAEQATFSAWLPQPQPTDRLLVGKVALDSSQRAFDVWNVRTQTWETFTYDGRPVDLPVADYAEASGRVRIRLYGNSGCTYPAIGLRRTGGAGS